MENQPSTTQVALKWGAITAIVLMVFSTIVNVTGNTGNQSLNYLVYPMLLAGIIMAIREFKSLNNNFLSFGQGFGTGTLTSAVAAVLNGIYTYVYMTFIDTTLTEKIMDKAREEWEKRGMTAEQMEQAEHYTKMFMSPGALFAFVVIFHGLFGIVVSLIASAIMKKDKPVFD